MLKCLLLLILPFNFAFAKNKPSRFIHVDTNGALFLEKGPVYKFIQDKKNGGTIKIGDGKEYRKILKQNFGIEDTISVVSLHDGKKTQHQIVSVKSMCCYGSDIGQYPGLELTHHKPKTEFKGIVVPRGFRVRSATPLETKLMTDYLSGPQFENQIPFRKSDFIDAASLAHFHLSNGKNKSYIIISDPNPAYGSNYLVFKLKNDQIERLEDIYFPGSGT